MSIHGNYIQAKDKLRFNDILMKLNSMFNSKNENQKDKFITALKTWLRKERISNDEKTKLLAIKFFLESKNIF